MMPDNLANGSVPLVNFAASTAAICASRMPALADSCDVVMPLSAASGTVPLSNWLALMPPGAENAPVNVRFPDESSVNLSAPPISKPAAILNLSLSELSSPSAHEFVP